MNLVGFEKGWQEWQRKLAICTERLPFSGR